MPTRPSDGLFGRGTPSSVITTGCDFTSYVLGAGYADTVAGGIHQGAGGGPGHYHPSAVEFGPTTGWAAAFKLYVDTPEEIDLSGKEDDLKSPYRMRDPLVVGPDGNDIPCSVPSDFTDGDTYICSIRRCGEKFTAKVCKIGEAYSVDDSDDVWNVELFTVPASRSEFAPDDTQKHVGAIVVQRRLPDPDHNKTGVARHSLEEKGEGCGDKNFLQAYHFDAPDAPTPDTLVKALCPDEGYNLKILVRDGSAEPTLKYLDIGDACFAVVGDAEVGTPVFEGGEEAAPIGYVPVTLRNDTCDCEQELRIPIYTSAPLSGTVEFVADVDWYVNGSVHQLRKRLCILNLATGAVTDKPNTTYANGWEVAANSVGISSIIGS